MDSAGGTLVKFVAFVGLVSFSTVVVLVILVPFRAVGEGLMVLAPTEMLITLVGDISIHMGPLVDSHCPRENGYPQQLVLFQQFTYLKPVWTASITTVLWLFIKATS